MAKKKKIKDKFKDFRSNDKLSFKTFKIPLKTILHNHKEIQPIIDTLVFDINDLVIHSYQFIRLYLLNCFTNKLQFPTIDETLIKCSIKTLGIRDKRGKKDTNIDLLEKLNAFYNTEYQPLVNHQKPSLKNTSFILPYLATQVHTCLSNNIQEHFLQHFFRFINKTTQSITEDKSILFKFKNKSLMLDETDEIFNEWKTTHLTYILPTDIKKNIHYDVNVKQFEYLKGLLYINSILEKEESKLFQPLRLRSNIIPKNVLLDTASIVSLFCPETDKDGNKHKKGIC